MTSKQKAIAEKWQAIIKEYEASGQTLRAFSGQRGMKVEALRYWKNRRIPALRRTAPQDLVEITAMVNPSSRIGGGIRIIFPSGIIVEPVADWNQAELTSTLTAVRSL